MPPLPPPGRPPVETVRVSSGFTRLVAAGPRLMTAELSNRSSSLLRTSTCCSSGTGRSSETITSVSPRTACSQSPNSSAFDTVALSETIFTSGGRWMMTSSQTAPRNRSAR